MRFLKFAVLSLLVCLMIPALACGEDLGVTALEPIAMTAEADAQVLELYCGPTQGFHRESGQTLDTGKDYVVFGQYDCWAMAAQGTPDAFGPVGWVEAGSIENLPYDPQLAFEDALVVTVEDEAALTNDFENAIVRIVPGTQVTLLAQFGDWGYVQAEFDDMLPIRAFIPMSAIL